nr:uncharacterized protein LOC108083575 isoform X3 [Drosophila kikkawai]
MVDEELSSALRDLPGRALSVPVEERQALFRNVSAVLRNPVASKTECMFTTLTLAINKNQTTQANQINSNT